MDTEGHLAYQGGKPLPGLCHCARDEAHDIEPSAPAPPEAYGWQLPVDGPVAVECWGAGNAVPARSAAASADFDVVAYVCKWGPPGAGPGWGLCGRTPDGEPVWRPLYG